MMKIAEVVEFGANWALPLLAQQLSLSKADDVFQIQFSNGKSLILEKHLAAVEAFSDDKSALRQLMPWHQFGAGASVSAMMTSALNASMRFRVKYHHTIP